MVGRNAGVVEILKAKYSHIILTETYNWFARSSLRQIEYQKTFNLRNNDKNPLKIIQCSNTRWLSIERAVKRIMDQWLVETHFGIMAHQERCYLSDQLSRIKKIMRFYNSYIQF